MRVDDLAALRSVNEMDEDRVANLFLASELAPQLCPDCERYHLRYVARRALETRDKLDKPFTIRLLAPLLAERADRNDGPIEVVVAGAADSGTLATAAAAAAAADVLARCRFTVLDRCPTPLMLCEAYGKSKRVTVSTATEDLLVDDAQHPADFVVVHSLFRHIPGEHYVALLRRFGSWLRPGGRIIFSTLLETPDGPKPDYAGVLEELREKLDAGALRVAEPVDIFMSRLGTESRTGGGRGLISELEEVRELAVAADLDVYAEDVAVSEWGAAGMKVKRRRGFAVLGERATRTPNRAAGGNQRAAQSSETPLSDSSSPQAR